MQKIIEMVNILASMSEVRKSDVRYIGVSNAFRGWKSIFLENY